MTLFRYFVMTLSRHSWHGIVSASSPGIAPQDSPDGKSETLDGAVLDDGLLGILRAGGRKPAGGRREGTDAALIEDDGYQQYPLQQECDEMPNTLHNSQFSILNSRTLFAIRSNRFLTRQLTSAEGVWRSDIQMKATASVFSCGTLSATMAFCRR